MRNDKRAERRAKMDVLVFALMLAAPFGIVAIGHVINGPPAPRVQVESVVRSFSPKEYAECLARPPPNDISGKAFCQAKKKKE